MLNIDFIYLIKSMIHYILGKAGIGKTQYCLQQFEKLSDGVFFFFPVDEKLEFLNFDQKTSKKCLIDCSSFYRKHLNDEKKFIKKMYVKIKNAINSHNTIFLDELQLYCCKELVQLILNAKDTNFYLIHQFPEQLEKSDFSQLYAVAEKKYRTATP